MSLLVLFNQPTGSGTTVAPGAGHLVFTGYAATVTQTANQTVAPGTGHLAFTGYAPTVARTANQVVAPGKGALTFTGYAVTVNRTANQSVAPGAGHLAFAGYAPTVTSAAGQTVAFGAGHLAFTGYAPSVDQTVSQVAPRLGGDDAPRKRKHQGFDLERWKREKQKPDQALESLIRNAYKRIFNGELPEEVREEVAQVLAPVIKPRARVVDVPKPAQIDWAAAAMREEIAQWIAQAEQDQEDEDIAAMLLL